MNCLSHQNAQYIFNEKIILGHVNSDHACMLNHFSPYLTLCDRKDYSLLGSSVHVILQATKLECIAMHFSRGFS